MALYSSQGASHHILKKLLQGEIEIALSVPVFKEYEAVLTRESALEQFGLTLNDVKTVLDTIAAIGKPTEIHYLWRPNLKDENDNMFVELAEASNSAFIVTANQVDFSAAKQLTFPGIQTITPKAFLKEIS